MVTGKLKVNSAVQNESQMEPSVVLFLLAVIFYAFCSDLSKITLPIIYQGRDLNRAFDLYFNHRFIWYGPEMTGGGNLPGPFYYILLGLPLLISDSLVAVVGFSYILAAGAAVAMWNFVSKFSKPGAFLTYFFFLSSPQVLNALRVSWNPSFVFLFLIVGIFALNKPQKDSWLAAGAAILGVALQVHFLAFVFLAAAVLALMLERSIDIEERLRKCSIIILSALMTALPFFIINSLKKGQIKTASGFNTGAFTFVERFLGDLLAPQSISTFYIFNSSEIFFFPALFVCLFLIRKIFKVNKFLGIAFLISLLLFPAVLQAPGVSRYLIPLIMTCALLVGLLTPQQFRDKGWIYHTFFLVAVILGIARNIFYFPDVSLNFSASEWMKLAAMAGLGFAFVLMFTQGAVEKLAFVFLLVATIGYAGYIKLVRALPQNDKSAYAGHLQVNKATQLLSAVINTSGWSYNDFAERTFFQGGSVEGDLSYFYKQLYRKKKNLPEPAFDGLLIRTSLITRTEVPVEIEQALKSGEIRCTERSEIDKYELCFYNFKDESQKRRLNNIGYDYRYSQPALFNIKSATGTEVMGPHEAVFYWNLCQNFEPACSVYFRIKIESTALRVEVLGDPLSSPVPWVNSAWSASLRKTAVKVTCGKDSVSYKVAENLGFNADKSSFLAPYDVFFPLPCADPNSIELVVPDTVSFFNNKRVVETDAVRFQWPRNASDQN
jgi:hypothetical protein